jgi:hypothetical protein
MHDNTTDENKRDEEPPPNIVTPNETGGFLGSLLNKQQPADTFDSKQQPGTGFSPRAASAPSVQHKAATQAQPQPHDNKLAGNQTQVLAPLDILEPITNAVSRATLESSPASKPSDAAQAGAAAAMEQSREGPKPPARSLLSTFRQFSSNAFSKKSSSKTLGQPEAASAPAQAPSPPATYSRSEVLATVKIRIGESDEVDLVILEDSDPEQLARSFVQSHGLPESAQAALVGKITEIMECGGDSDSEDSDSDVSVLSETSEDSDSVEVEAPSEGDLRDPEPALAPPEAPPEPTATDDITVSSASSNILVMPNDDESVPSRRSSQSIGESASKPRRDSDASRNAYNTAKQNWPTDSEASVASSRNGCASGKSESPGETASRGRSSERPGSQAMKRSSSANSTLLLRNAACNSMVVGRAQRPRSTSPSGKCSDAFDR